MYVQIRQAFHPSSPPLRILTRVTLLKQGMYDLGQTPHLNLCRYFMVDS